MHNEDTEFPLIHLHIIKILSKIGKRLDSIFKDRRHGSWRKQFLLNKSCESLQKTYLKQITISYLSNKHCTNLEASNHSLHAKFRQGIQKINSGKQEKELANSYLYLNVAYFWKTERISIKVPNFSQIKDSNAFELSPTKKYELERMGRVPIFFYQFGCGEPCLVAQQPIPYHRRWH